MTDSEHNLDLRSEAERLAAEYLERVELDPATDTDAFAARLASASARAEFLELVHIARSTEKRFPQRVAAGTTLAGRYRILEQIGKGGMGRVFAAFDTQLERKVALKVMNALDLGDAAREELFRRESRLLAALQHPGIVAIHELGLDGDVTFIAMDLVDGVALDRFLERARERLGATAPSERGARLDGEVFESCIDRELPPGRASLIDESWYRTVARVAVEIARTIEAAHERNVVHRDLKPSNILLIGGGHPVLLDFGFAGRREGSGGAVTEGFYGTVAYVAPEQAQSLRVGSDPTSDIYQLGLVLYELLTLEGAFPGEDMLEILEAIRVGRYAAPRDIDPHVPRELEAICLKALELSPSNRYATAREFSDDLDRYLRGDLPLALRTHRWRRAVHRVRRAVRARPLSAGVALTAVASLVGWAGFSVYATTHWIDVEFLHAANKPPYTTAPLGAHDVVAPDELLGVRIDTRRPIHIYAFSSWEDQHGDRYLEPIDAQPLEGFEHFLSLDPDARRKVRAKIRVTGQGAEVGSSTFLCARTSESNRREGLWLCICPDEDPTIESWIARMPPDVSIAYDEVLALLADPHRVAPAPTNRGGSASDGPAVQVNATLADPNPRTLRELASTITGATDQAGEIRLVRVDWAVAKIKLSDY